MRTKLTNTTYFKIDTQQEPVVLSKHLMDLLLQSDHGSDCLALYCFYYYTAKWQKTNQPKATTEYTAKGLNWGIGKVRMIKNILRELHLIEDIVIRKDNVIIGHFIKVNFIWTNINSHPNSFPPGGSSHPMENERGNALSKSNINALSNSKKNIFLPLATFLSKIIEEKKEVKHTTAQIQSWTKEISKLIEINEVSMERIKTALRWYKDHCKDDYVPVIESGSSLRSKFIKLEAAMERSKKVNKQNTVGYKETNKKYREPDLYV
jgi:hypothetical protein